MNHIPAGENYDRIVGPGGDKRQYDDHVLRNFASTKAYLPTGDVKDIEGYKYLGIDVGSSQPIPNKTTFIIPPIKKLLTAVAVILLAIILRQLSTGSSLLAKHLYKFQPVVARPRSTMPGGKLQFQYRPSQTRGGANHGWLKTSHTFSFADYYDPAFASFGSLRVINEDRVAPGTGFPTHPHREFEIFSYIVSGELTHKDNMGNVEIMRRGDVQMTSGGTGIAHSEYNDNQSQEVHFLQIWAKPNQHGLKPQHFADDQKTDILREIVAPVSQDKVQDAREGDGPTPVHSAFHVFASLLNPGKSLKHTYKPTLRGDGPKLFYAQLVQTSGYNTAAAPKDASKGALVKLSSGDNQVTLGEGDGVFVRGGETGDGIDIENIGQLRGELILFEMDG